LAGRIPVIGAEHRPLPIMVKNRQNQTTMKNNLHNNDFPESIFQFPPFYKPGSGNPASGQNANILAPPGPQELAQAD